MLSSIPALSDARVASVSQADVCASPLETTPNTRLKASNPLRVM